MNDGFASLRTTRTMTGTNVGRSALLYAAELTRGIWPGEFPKILVKGARIVLTASAETRPATLRPRHTRWQQHLDLKLADGSQHTSDQSHDLE